MTRTFIQTLEFSKSWDLLGFSDDDLRELEKCILFDPTRYPVMRGTGGLRKTRFALNKHGKSSGVRVCFVDFPLLETTYLITVYPKNVKDNLTMSERQEIKKMIENLKKELGG
ncbi:MAG: addiction module toxin RelE [Lachnospiraceae bacterium]|nr:addiction module toxin RelE [Lachnospiraceae bacterium]